LTDVRQMILQDCESVARTVDSGLTLLYRNAGVRIRKDILPNTHLSWKIKKPRNTRRKGKKNQ
jgi:hypothetical protein